jgi:hypothetical protein
VGARRTGSPRTRTRRYEHLRPRGLGGRALVDRDRRRAPRVPHHSGAGSTSRRFARSRSRASAPARSSSGSARTTLTGSAADHLHAALNRQRGHRVRLHGHPPRRRAVRIVTGTAFGRHGPGV